MTTDPTDPPDRVTHDVDLDGGESPTATDWLDEVCVWSPTFVHLERMDDGHIWIGIHARDGRQLRIDLWTARRAKIRGRAEWEGA